MSRLNDRENRAKKESLYFRPVDFFKTKSHVEIEGNKKLTLEGSRGVLEYTTECIRISVEDFVLTITGRGLTLKCISPTAMIIEGFILGLSFLN